MTLTIGSGRRVAVAAAAAAQVELPVAYPVVAPQVDLGADVSGVQLRR